MRRSGAVMLKNYTSSVAVAKSISEIEELLGAAGAEEIRKQYGENSQGVRVVMGFTFTIPTTSGPMTFRLPADVSQFADTMAKDVRRPRKGTLARVTEQAERTAWRVLKDWVEIQITLIRIHKVNPMQVFMGYLYDARSKETLFERAERTGFQKLLAAGKSTQSESVA